MDGLHEGLLTVHEAAGSLRTDVDKIDYHFRYHEEHFTSRDLEKIIVKVKSDLLEIYDSLQNSYESIKDDNDPRTIKTKIDLSKEIRSLKKDIGEFIQRHSARIAKDHQDLEAQWNRMAEFVVHDTCPKCKKALAGALTGVKV